MAELWLEELSALKRDLGPLRPMLMRFRRREVEEPTWFTAPAHLPGDPRWSDVTLELYPLDVRAGQRPAVLVPAPRRAPLRDADQGVRVRVAGRAEANHAVAVVLPDGMVVFCAGAADRPSRFDRARWPGAVADEQPWWHRLVDL